MVVVSVEIILTPDRTDYSFKSIEFLIKRAWLTLFNYLLIVQLGIFCGLRYSNYDCDFFGLVCTLQVFISIIATAVLYRIKKDLE